MRDRVGAKLLNIKAYDKILDLIGREATHLVSSRLSTILASGKDPGAFESMIRRNQRCGVTRLEVSICREALDRHNLLRCDYGGNWNEKICTAMGQLVEYVLNDRDILEQTYRSVSVSSIITSITRSNHNLLAVGKRHSWIINARTGHRNHFVGTRAVAGMT